ncbi:hypothetical protein, partial [Streptococcus anginosus]|uniref:hypothetical protein n=1 Tax=Streptococcus anginosus TaxID=1328 RepID=UPI002EDB736E
LSTDGILFSLKQKKKILSFASGWMNPEVLSKQISQVQRDTWHRSYFYVEPTTRQIQSNESERTVSP